MTSSAPSCCPRLRLWLLPLVAAGLGLVVGLLAGRSTGDGPTPDGHSSATTLATPARQEQVQVLHQAQWHEAVGTIAARHSSTLSARIQAQVVAVEVEAGNTVEADQVVIRLQSDELQARLSQAGSALAAARAQATVARQAYERIVALHEAGTATNEQREQAEARHLAAMAELEASEQRRREAEVFAGYTTITAPLGGLVAERLVEPGDLVWPGRAMLVIHDPRHLRLEADIREGLIDRITVGQELTVDVRALGRLITAPVEDIIPVADPASRSLRVRLGLGEVEGAYPGMFATLRVPLDSRPTLLVPETAISIVGQLATVRCRDEDGLWRRRYVTLGARHDQQREVLSGLRPGDQIGWDEAPR